MIRVIVFSVLSWLSAAVMAAAPYSTEPCAVAESSAAVAARLQCGRLQVQSADGSVFQLAVLRKAAAQPVAGAAPVLYLHGGAAGDVAALLAQSDDDVVPGHELIAVDLRGSGRSTPAFCPELAGALQQALARSDDDARLLQSRREALLQCLQQMLAQGYSPADFGAVQIVNDVELLREQLNITQWHLYARSAGTVAALHYLAVAPQALASVTLDSVYLPDQLLTSFKLQQDQWLRQLDLLCQQQAGCAGRFGALPELFNRALQRVSQAPLRIGPPGAALLLTPEKLRLAVMAAALSEQPLSLLPLWLEAVGQGDVRLLARWAEVLLASGALPTAAGMAGECADRLRFYQPGRADSLEQLAGLPDGVCAAFGAAASALPQVPETAKVRTPVLLLAGGLDLFQPDSLVLSQWLGPHSQLVAVPGALHGVRAGPACLRKMVSDFIHTPERFGPPACLAQLTRPYLVSAVTPDAQVATEFAAAVRFKPSVAGMVFLLCLTLAALLALVWPLLVGLWRWLSDQHQPVDRAGLVSGALVLLTLVGWAGFAAVLWQGISRQSAELWLGLPVQSQIWQLYLAVATVPALLMVWWLARRQQWRQLLAQCAMLGAALAALALHLLP